MSRKAQFEREMEILEKDYEARLIDLKTYNKRLVSLEREMRENVKEKYGKEKEN